MYPTTLCDGLLAVLRRPPALLTCLGLLLSVAALSPALAQYREPVYSPDRGVATAPEPQEADWPARVGRIAEVQGTVRLLDREENQWVAAALNRPVTSGDQFVTQPGARVQISIGSTAVRLDGDSELALRRLDDEAVVLQLRRGSMAVQAMSDEMAAQVDVHTAEGRFRLREAGSYRIDRWGDASHATAWRGSLRFEGRDSLLVVGRSQHAEIWLEGSTTHYRWAEDVRDDFATWVTRDERAEARGESARYVSPEMTGWEDLDRHGRWENHPEYGAIWIPLVVAADWAPYRSGHWAWISPWGWTWIDDARWGFAPFHYGRWVHWNQRWCWVPGHRSVRPVYSPALVAWIGGGRVSVGIGSSIGWVPLGPRDTYHRYRWHDSGSDRGYDRDRPRGRVDERQPVPAAPRAAPTGPVFYSNQRVPGAVTTVTPEAFAGHRVVPVTSSGVSTLRGITLGTPITAAPPPPAPPRVAGGRDGLEARPGRDAELRAPPAEGVPRLTDPRDVSTRPVQPRDALPRGQEPREVSPRGPDGHQGVPRPADLEPRTPLPGPERGVTPPRSVTPAPRAPEAEPEHDRRRSGRVPGGEGTGRAAPYGAPIASPAPPALPAVTPPVPVPAAPRGVAPPPAVSPPPSAAPPRTPADAPRGQPPAQERDARERDRDREEDRSGRPRGPEPRENGRGQSR